MFGISTPCAHDWENEYKAVQDLEVAYLQEEIESKNDSASDVHSETHSQKESVQDLHNDHTTQSVSAGEIARRINNVTKAQTRVATTTDEDEEDEKHY